MGRSQDGRLGGRGIHVFAQLGHLPGTGGVPWTPKGMGGTPSDRLFQLYFYFSYYIFYISNFILFYIIWYCIDPYFFFSFFFSCAMQLAGSWFPGRRLGPSSCDGSWVQTTGLTENLRPQGILIVMRPPRGHHSTKTQLYTTACKFQCWTLQAKNQ